MDKNIKEYLPDYPEECLSVCFDNIKCKTPLDIVVLYEGMPIQAFQIIDYKGEDEMFLPPSTAILVLNGINIQIPTYRLYINEEKGRKIVPSKGGDVDAEMIINYSEAQKWMLAHVSKNCRVRYSMLISICWVISAMSLLTIAALYLYTALFCRGMESPWLCNPIMNLVALYSFVLFFLLIKEVIHNKS